MPFVPTQGVAMATLNYQSNDGTTAINRLFCATATPPTMVDLEEIGDAIYDAWVANIATYTQSDWALAGVHVRAMNEEEGLQYDDENLYPMPGESVQTVQIPAQVSYTVTLNSGLVGRSARGRIYGIGLPMSFQLGNRLTDAARGVLQPSWNLFRSALETAGHALQIVSFQEDGVLRAEGRPLPVVSVNVRFPLATQRRRLT